MKNFGWKVLIRILEAGELSKDYPETFASGVSRKCNLQLIAIEMNSNHIKNPKILYYSTIKNFLKCFIFLL